MGREQVKIDIENTLVSELRLQKVLPNGLSTEFL